MLARALEQVGDRWTLLVVRALLGAPRRSTDLLHLPGGITPKTLRQPLRALQDAGLVEVDRQPGRREVWYRLTPAGRDLAPVVESLFLWGLRHAGRLPRPGEAVHAEHLLAALRITLDQAPPPHRPLVWQLHFTDDRSYTLRSGSSGWTLAPGVDDEDPPDVLVTTDTPAWTRFLMTPPEARTADAAGVELRGGRREVDRFLERLAPFPYALSTTPP